MSLTKQVNGVNTTITIAYTAPTQKVADVLSDCAKYLYDAGQTAGVVLAENETVDDLTNSDIATIIDAHVLKVIRDAAKTYHTNQASENAKITAITETETRYM